MKRILTSIIFILILTKSCIYIVDILKFKGNRYNTPAYFIESQNIDICFIGTSLIFYSMSPMEIWDKYGLVSYNRGSSDQFYKLSLLMIEEFIKRHKPKIVIFDSFLLFKQTDTINATKASIYNMVPKYLQILYFYNIYGKLPDNLLNIFHNRWKELWKGDFYYETFWKGKFSGNDLVSAKMHTLKSQNYVKNNFDTKYTLDNNTINVINQLKLLEDKYNIKIIFISTPRILDDKLYTQHVLFTEFAKKKELIFINYNSLYDTINFNFKSDLMDKIHLNLYGSRKVMDHLMPYIIEHYNIPNRKNDPAYASWNDDYIKYARAINREEIRELKTFAEWKKQAFYDNYTVMISTNGDVLKKLPDTLKNDLKAFGLKKYNTDKANMRYAAIIDNNNVFFEEISDEKAEYKGRMNNIVNLFVSSENKKATINVSGKPRAKNKYGLNFVIYDKVNREIVDSIWIDPSKPDVVRR